MKILITLITFLSLLWGETGSLPILALRKTGEKEVIASVQVRIIIPARTRNISKQNSKQSETRQINNLTTTENQQKSSDYNDNRKTENKK